MSVNSYPRETKEFVPILVKVNEVVVTVGVVVAIVPTGSRPTTWVAATTLDGDIGTMIDNLTPGNWTVFAKVTDMPEVPVVDCGKLKIT